MAKKKTSTVTSRTPLQDRLAEAEAAGQYMVAVWQVRDGQLHLYRVTSEFPVNDFGGAVELLRTDLEQEKAGAAAT